jgi:hypothetical protein
VSHAGGGLPPITPWPPLITAAAQPRWMVWRDRLLTLGAWLLLALLCRNALITISGEVMQSLGLAENVPAPDFHEHMRRMQPYWVAVGLLLLWVGTWAMVWVLRRRLTRPAPMPEPLDPPSEAARHGADPAALLAWRDMRIAIVHVNEGRMHAVAPEPKQADAAP